MQVSITAVDTFIFADAGAVAAAVAFHELAAADADTIYYYDQTNNMNNIKYINIINEINKNNNYKQQQQQQQQHRQQHHLPPHHYNQ
jgi:hypothetical protein